MTDHKMIARGAAALLVMALLNWGCTGTNTGNPGGDKGIDEPKCLEESRELAEEEATGLVLPGRSDLSAREVLASFQRSYFAEFIWQGEYAYRGTTDLVLTLKATGPLIQVERQPEDLGLEGPSYQGCEDGVEWSAALLFETADGRFKESKDVVVEIMDDMTASFTARMTHTELEGSFETNSADSAPSDATNETHTLSFRFTLKGDVAQGELFVSYDYENSTTNTHEGGASVEPIATFSEDES